MSEGGEFGFIARRLAPLAGDGALGLVDDAALVSHPAGDELVICADMLIAGRHFLAEDGAELAARRALRVNLSDLAAMGAAPAGYLTCVAWPDDADAADRAAFAYGLARDQAVFGVSLLGGDTTSGSGPLTISITMIGRVPKASAMLRSGARAGDRLIVTGVIGDGRLGLKAARGELSINPDDGRALARRFRLPQPRLEIAAPLRRYAHAAIDVSDGLIADAGHIARASGLALSLDLEKVRLSDPARTWRARRSDRVAATAWLASGGDDYELACAVAPDRADAFIDACAGKGLAAAPVGVFEAGEGVRTHWSGAPVIVDRAGFTHF